MEKNLDNTAALEKYRNLAEDIGICMLISAPDDTQTARPMSTTKVEEDGTTWFFTSIVSGKIEEIRNDHLVRMIYAHPGKSSYMDVWGVANVVKDKQKIQELWNPIVKAWFPDGVDDPNLCLIRVNPSNAHYWDSEQGRMIQFMKIITSAVTGQKLSQGVEGSLNL